MAFTIFYPMESPFERRHMYYRSPWWNSSVYRDTISNYYDDWVDSFTQPTSYAIIKRKVKPVKRSRQDDRQDDLKDKESTQSCYSDNASNEGTPCPSQSAPNQDIKQTKKLRQDTSKSSSIGNASKKNKQKSSTNSKKHRALIPWFSTLDIRPWQNFSDILQELTSDDVFTSHEDDTEADVEHSSTDSNSQDIMASRSYTEYQTGSNNKDKYTYHKSSSRKRNGERKTVITQSIGDQKHTITTVIDAEGNEHQTEDYINVEENGIQQFQEGLKKFQIDQADNPKRPQLCNEEASSDQSNSDSNTQ